MRHRAATRWRQWSTLPIRGRGRTHAAMPKEEGFYTIAEAAAVLGLTASAVRAAIANKRLATMDKIGARLNRLAVEEVERYQREQQNRRGWARRKAPGYTPDRSRADAQRAYRERRRAAAGSDEGGTAATPPAPDAGLDVDQ